MNQFRLKFFYFNQIIFFACIGFFYSCQSLSAPSSILKKTVPVYVKEGQLQDISEGNPTIEGYAYELTFYQRGWNLESQFKMSLQKQFFPTKSQSRYVLKVEKLSSQRDLPLFYGYFVFIFDYQNQPYYVPKLAQFYQLTPFPTDQNVINSGDSDFYYKQTLYFELSPTFIHQLEQTEKEIFIQLVSELNNPVENIQRKIIQEEIILSQQARYQIRSFLNALDLLNEEALTT